MSDITHDVAMTPDEVRGARDGNGAAVQGGGPDERSHLIALFAGIVEPLGQSLPPSAEVVLHDLNQLPNSIVAVHGDVTGRRVGDPATDLLLEQASTGEFRDMVGYRTQLMDGRTLRSTTMIVRTSDGVPVAALCLNSDTTAWQSVERIARAMIGRGPEDENARSAPSASAADDRSTTEVSGELFAHDVDELAAHLIHQAIRDQDVPVDLMRKEHKLAVVRDLKARGLFMLRDAVEMIAGSLQVTRFTIYNYLNEIGDEPGEQRPARRKATQ
ncbi:helix-turn-helix transcriptional regulator [Georgenia deserti]|uniref:Transcriptional regulator n=1 Tax=Georgenia deserti TaxID=2093781 RepID=A0ABW4L373_9MICO